MLNGLQYPRCSLLEHSVLCTPFFFIPFPAPPPAPPPQNSSCLPHICLQISCQVSGKFVSKDETEVLGRLLWLNSHTLDLVDFVTLVLTIQGCFLLISALFTKPVISRKLHNPSELQFFNLWIAIILSWQEFEKGWKMRALSPLLWCDTWREKGKRQPLSARVGWSSGSGGFHCIKVKRLHRTYSHKCVCDI